MSKRGDRNHTMMVEALRFYGSRRNDPLPENPPPGEKWKAVVGLFGLDINNSHLRVMWCLIEHANSANGVCYPSQDRIGFILGMGGRKVERAIAALKSFGLIKTLPRYNEKGQTSSAYIINWKPLFEAFEAMGQRAKEASSWRSPTQVTVTLPTAMTVTPPSPVTVEPSYIEPSNKNLRPERVPRSSSASTDRMDDILDALLKEERPEQVERPVGLQRKTNGRLMNTTSLDATIKMLEAIKGSSEDEWREMLLDPAQRDDLDKTLLEALEEAVGGVH